MRTAAELRGQRMADPAYRAHVEAIVAQMPEPTEDRIRTVRNLIQSGRREAARAGCKVLP